MPIRGKKGSGAPATASDLESLAIKGRVRAEGVHLSPAEGKILQDPDWITEDEADRSWPNGSTGEKRAAPSPCGSI